MSYLKTNLETWNNKVAHHVASEFYNLDKFMAGETSLNNIELALLGDLKGKKILHLQCHFGQDTLSLSRMGAKCTGVDLSDKAIKQAKKLNEELGLSAEFICSDIYDLPNHLHDQFDLVFTSYGTIGWLPDLDKWAQVIQQFLKPEGKLIFVEFHPFIWMHDDDFSEIKYSYFNVEPIIEEELGTYANREAKLKQKSITWNHPLSEVFQSLIDKGLEITHFNEYDYSPYNCFNGTEKISPKKYILKQFGRKIPLVYSIIAQKK